jgi:hypothetical protein
MGGGVQLRARDLRMKFLRMMDLIADSPGGEKISGCPHISVFYLPDFLFSRCTTSWSPDYLIFFFAF